MRPAELVPAPAVPARETFSVGSAISRSLSIWSRNIVFFVGVSVAAYVPLFVLAPVTPTKKTMFLDQMERLREMANPTERLAGGNGGSGVDSAGRIGRTIARDDERASRRVERCIYLK